MLRRPAVAVEVMRRPPGDALRGTGSFPAIHFEPLKCSQLPDTSNVHTFAGDIALTLRGEPATARLAQTAGWQATLVCEARDGGSCDPARPRYVLLVSDARKPDWVTRLIRRIVPIIPRIELAPLISGGE